MNRTRCNQLRRDREMEGLQQVPQMPQLLNPTTPARKTTYTRAELLQRAPTSTALNRAKRLPTLHNGNTKAPASPRLAAPSGEVVANRRTSATRTHFLPRVAKLASNNNTNNNSNNNSLISTGKALSRDKSPARNKPKFSAYLPSNCDSSSLYSYAQRLPLQQEQKEQQKEVQQQQQLQLQQEQLQQDSCSASSSMSNSSNDLRKMKLAKAFRLPEEQNKSFVYLCKPVKQVKQLLMARSLHNSNDNVARDEAMEQELYDFYADTESRHISAVSSNSCSYCSSYNFPLETEMQSYQGMLETQLQDVRQREQQLQQLAAKVQQERSSEAEASRERKRDKEPQRERDKLKDKEKDSNMELAVVKPPERDTAQQRSFELEFVCQNIPTLQREIKLLQQLGEKLEATLLANSLQPTTTPRSTPQSELPLVESRTVFYTPRSTLNIFGYDGLPIRYMGWRLEEQTSHLEQRACVVANRLCFGFIREFRIETKTLSELKTADETQCFYLPLAENGGLERTSFRQLRENPSILLQQLRSVTPSRPFNLLEQDAMFFNSMLSHADVPLICNKRLSAANVPPLILEPLPVRETGGGGTAESSSRTLTWTPADVERMLISTVNATVQCEITPAASPRCQKPLAHRRSIKCFQTARWKCPKVKPNAKIAFEPQEQQRRATVRQVAPQSKEDFEPAVQTQLFKTILVGIVQIAVFLILIMAFTYPDIRC